MTEEAAERKSMVLDGINRAQDARVYTQNKTNRASNGSFHQKLDQAKGRGEFTLHCFDAPEGEKALGAQTDRNGSMTVYKPKDFDLANPMYKVRTWDADGNMTERMVDLSKVDARSSSREEMYAYSCYLSESGQYAEAQNTFSRISGFAGESTSDFFHMGKWNWLDLARSIMQMQYQAGNTQGYLNYKQFVDFFK